MFLGIIERGGTASLRSRTCVKRNAVFGARFKGLSLHFLYKRQSDTYQDGLGYISDTYPNPYPPVTVSPYWETDDFYTPPVLGVAALFRNSAPVVYKKVLCPKDPELCTPLALNCRKGQHLPALPGSSK